VDRTNPGECPAFTAIFAKRDKDQKLFFTTKITTRSGQLNTDIFDAGKYKRLEARYDRCCRVEKSGAIGKGG